MQSSDSIETHGDPGRKAPDWALLRAALLALDAFTVWGSLSLAYVLRIGSGLLGYEAPYDPADYRLLILLSVPIWLGLFAALGLYQRDTLMGGLSEYQQVFKASTSAMVTVILVSFLSRDAITISRGWLLLSWGLSFVLLMLERFTMRRLAYAARRRGHLTARVLLVGADDQGIAMADQWLHTATSGMKVVGFLDDFKPVGTPVLNGLKVLGRPTALRRFVRELKIDEVIVVPTAVAWETFESIVASASAENGFTLRLSPGLYEILTTSVAVTSRSFVPLFSINGNRLVGLDAMAKLVVDYALALPLLTVASPLMVALSLGLWLSNPAHRLLDGYKTMGQGGSVFAMYKFHTGIDRELFDREVRAADTDRRKMPWLARHLYSTGLDKLPQLWNVLAGQMSLVGPRPRVIGEANVDGRAIRNLQTIKPGIIGPWAVAAPSACGDDLRGELSYVRNWTVWLDLQIISQAIRTLMHRGGPNRRNLKPVQAAGSAPSLPRGADDRPERSLPVRGPSRTSVNHEAEGAVS